MRTAREAENPTKKGISATGRGKKPLAKARACAIFRADSLRAASNGARLN
jgi:hypothetical protein